MKEWVDILFDTWYSCHACPRRKERGNPTIDPGIAPESEWTDDSIFQFFEIKDREYCLKFSIEDGIKYLTLLLVLLRTESPHTFQMQL